MLSYQHIYHAGNLADVHKHTLLAWMLDYLTRKDKPLSYVETHAGRALYDLNDPAARKTGEAEKGIARDTDFFDDSHPLARVLDTIRLREGQAAYPGSPMIAASLLRKDDRIHLAELHPGEFEALRYAMAATQARCYQRDGFDLAHSLCPPMPRRGLMLIDPSYEIKSDYADIPKQIKRYAKAWNVGVIALWYPILKVSTHRSMLNELQTAFPEALRYEVSFPAAKDGHGMIGSGMFVINAPYGLANEARRLSSIFETLRSNS